MPEIEKTLRVFISHCSKDHFIARELYLQLIAEGWMELWFIEANLKPSQNWDAEIRTAVENADVIIALLSKSSTEREEHIYPDPHFIFDLIESRSGGDVLLIPLQLDNSMDLEESEVIVYFPKKRRRLFYSQVLSKLKSHAIQQGFSTDVVVREPELEQHLQWSPTKWRELGGVSGEDVIDDESFEQKPARPPSKWKSKVFAGASRLLYFSLAVFVLFVVLALGLAVNFVNTGETVNDLAAPVISRVLTLAPLPTPTLGVDSTRVSSVDGMRMVYVPAGEFIMGSDNGAEDEKPARSVYLDSYWIDQFEITNGMYKICVDHGKCNPPDYRLANEWFHLELIPLVKPIIRNYDDPRYENYSISRITWDNANSYCTWVGRRLPTEAEWEKAARGTDGRTYPWGENVDCTHANIYAFPPDEACAYAPTHVGSYENGVSPFGVYDMAGNVFEFVSDDYEYVFESENNVPLGFSIIIRLRKGGSWITSGQVARSANREFWNPAIENIDPNSLEFFDPDGENGFRCATSGEAQAPQSSNTPVPTREIVSQVLPVDRTNMVFVPAGEFIMGGDAYFEEQPIHQVVLDAFWIDQTEVTNGMFESFLNEWGNHEEGGATLLDDEDEDARIHFVGGLWRSDPMYEDHPVVEVTWYGANAYCAWAGQRLPTEAEWEKAARGTDGRTYPWGNGSPTPDWLNFDNFIGTTVPADVYLRGMSPYGALNMAGNVWEWVADIHSRTYYSISPVHNPLGPDTGFFRVLRGGGWNSRDTYVRSMHRNRGAPTISHHFVGFRCAQSD